MNLVVLMVLGLLTFYGCTDTDDGKYTAPITLYEKVNGNWSLTSITQIDETAKVTNVKPDEVNLTKQLGFATFGLTLTVDDNHRPTSYQVTGSAPQLFAGSGYWDLDVEFQPTDGTAPVINLYSDAGKATLVGQLQITGMPGTAPSMELKLTRKSGGAAFVSYNYQLTKY